MDRIPFTLEAWLADKSRRVETRDGRPARIICTDAKAADGACVIALIPGYGGEEAYQFFPNGYAFSSKSSDEVCADLFLVTPEPELSEFESKVKHIVDNLTNNITYRNVMKERFNRGDEDEQIKEYASELLTLARKELQPEIDAEVEKAYKNADRMQYEKGREDALKDRPTWKKCEDGNTDRLELEALCREAGSPIEIAFRANGYRIFLSDLGKLPKEDQQ